MRFIWSLLKMEGALIIGWLVGDLNYHFMFKEGQPG